jgi:hypothetical protein
MKKSELKLLAACMVKESKMTKSAKIQMFNFIQHEATEPQLKALLLDGKITKLDEQAQEIINDRFSVHPLNEANPKMKIAIQKCGHITDKMKKKECFKKVLHS